MSVSRLRLVRPSRAQYDEAFENERARRYPVVDEFERACGHKISRKGLEEVARVLACPVKANPPNWQHGRVLYAALRKYISSHLPLDYLLVLDIGTAKGFSALCMRCAIGDAGDHWPPGGWNVVSVDVIDPAARVYRNTVAEVDGPLTLAEMLGSLADGITFLQSTGIGWLSENSMRINFAFVDGKHKREVVETELNYLARWQQIGDMVVVDDVHMEGIAKAVDSVLWAYDMRDLTIIPGKRRYAVGTRR